MFFTNPNPFRSMMNQHTPLIELRGLVKKFDGHIALNGIDLTIANGEFLTLLGPSGCGKTTILRILSGFERPDEGKVLIAGQDMSHMPPEARQVNTVFQNYALFPHMNVFDNVAFGLRMQGLEKAIINKKVQEALDMVRLGSYGERKPTMLSGGQQQRVALARAIVNEPLVLLLDEPFSALDYQLRCQMQRDIKQLQRNLGITFIFVTHDQEEAFAMSDRVVVMDNGHISQIGTPQSIYEDPANLYVAKFVGEINILVGKIVKKTDDGNYDVLVQNTIFPVPSKREFNEGDMVNVLVRPEDLRIYHEYEERPEGPTLSAFIDDTVYKGATVDIHVHLGNDGTALVGAEFFDEDAMDIDYRHGEPVYVTWVSGWEVVLPYEDA